MHDSVVRRWCSADRQWCSVGVCKQAASYIHSFTNVNTEVADARRWAEVLRTRDVTMVFTSVVEMRGGGGSGGVKPPKCARKCANFRNMKANVQILDRKTPPPNVLPYFAYWFTTIVDTDHFPRPLSSVSRHVRPFPSPPVMSAPRLSTRAGHDHHLPLIGHGRAGSGC